MRHVSCASDGRERERERKRERERERERARERVRTPSCACVKGPCIIALRVGGSHTWNDSFISTVTHSSTTSLIYIDSIMCSMTHFNRHSRVWLLDCSSRGVGMWHDTSMSTVTHSSATWLICIATHTCVILALPFAWRWHVTWLIHVDRDSFWCDWTHLYCHTRVWMVRASPFPRLSCDMSHSDPPTWLLYIHRHDSFIFTNMTHSSTAMTHACCHSHVWTVLASPFSFMSNVKMSHVAREWGNTRIARVCVAE